MSPEPERSGHRVGLAAMGGFVLGAATVLLVVWFYGAGRHAEVASVPPPPSAAVPAPPAAAEGVPWSAPRPAPMGASVPPVAAPGAPPPASDGGATAGDLQNLARRQLLLPVAGVKREGLVNSYEDARSGGRTHHALDIPAPRNTPVLAVEDGTIAKLFTSNLGGLTLYEFDPSATYSYYYAHLERYADGLKEGDRVRRGQVLGYVGSTGDAAADAPHLHFEIVRLNPDKHWWQGTPINPFLVLHGPAGDTLAGK
jgi:murein DD-endopeptidase MepM/ murein hydrolase activator NlpD